MTTQSKCHTDSAPISLVFFLYLFAFSLPSFLAKQICCSFIEIFSFEVRIGFSYIPSQLNSYIRGNHKTINFVFINVHTHVCEWVIECVEWRCMESIFGGARKEQKWIAMNTMLPGIIMIMTMTMTLTMIMIMVIKDAQRLPSRWYVVPRVYIHIYY